jgi:hypothetical protein
MPKEAVEVLGAWLPLPGSGPFAQGASRAGSTPNRVAAIDAIHFPRERAWRPMRSKVFLLRAFFAEGKTTRIPWGE